MMPGETLIPIAARLETAPAGSRWSRPWVRVLLAALLVGGLWWWLRDHVDVHTVHEQAQRLNAGVGTALLFVLPLLGFPASLLHVAVGMRFGVGLGLLLVGLSIGFQIAVSYAVVMRWRRPFERRFGSLRRRIPSGAHRSIAILAVLMPGAPYAGINYALPLAGVPLRTLLLYCWPLHLLRSTITVAFGDQSDQLTPARLAGFAGYAVVLIAGSWMVYRRLRHQLGDPPAAEDDRTPRG